MRYETLSRPVLPSLAGLAVGSVHATAVDPELGSQD